MAMATIRVIEHCQVPPSTDSPTEFSLPLVFFDMICWFFPQTQSVLFFDFPNISKSHFLDSIVPNLKQSLSLTLKHFLPLAGRIIQPLISGERPISLYRAGDSVSLTVAESSADFNHLTGNHPRNSAEYYCYAPQLPSATRSSDSISVPVFALQVTLFPKRGLCFGFINHHAIGGANAVLSFVKAWALINKKLINSNNIGSDSEHTTGQYLHQLLPSFDRRIFQHYHLNGLNQFFWDFIMKTGFPLERPPIKPPTGKFRATFILTEDQLQKLKKLVSAKRPSLTHVSSFTVACALMWVCSAKSAIDNDDDDVEYFVFEADCKTRLHPPLRNTYFGNSLALGKSELNYGRLKGNDGFLIAAEIIGHAVKETVYNDKGILHDADEWPSGVKNLIGKPQFPVAGSPRFDFYSVDYGWGRPNKFEALFIDDDEGAIYISSSKLFAGGLEIGISRPEIILDSLAVTFTELLADLLAQGCNGH